jgi:DNA-binding transcriptional MerR regulator
MTEITNIISAFSADQVVKLTGLTIRQLAYWDSLKFFQPQYASDDRRSPYSRIYSFKDVVGLRTLSVLKTKHKCSLPHLREVAKKLSTYSITPWADLTLYVWKRKVYFKPPEIPQTQGVLDGQYMLLPISSVMEDVRRDAERLRHRAPEQIGKIEKRRYLSHQAEVISGTRIRVATILHFLEAGYSNAAILKEYPSLTEADIEAAKRHGRGLAA